ncbi:MAG: cyclic lactone autoinducer peptide [Firmicutes bacterium]|nr:cyclic lactone autoinducer peptide [Bacillota bacterium]
MLRIIKKLMFTPVVMLALLVAVVGIKPASFFWFYQPAPPVKSE